MAQRQRTVQGAALQPARTASSRRRVIIPGVATIAVAAVLLAATLLFKQPAPTAAPTTSGSAATPCGSSGPATGLLVGQCAPDFTLDDVSGRSVSLSSYLGHPVLLHFWAVGCTNCRAEFPDFSRAVSAYTPKGLKVIAVDAWGESAQMVANWQGINHLPVAAMLVDPSVGVPQQYNGTGTPTTYFIDRNGRIVAKNTGQSSYDYFQQHISQII